MHNAALGLIGRVLKITPQPAADYMALLKVNIKRFTGVRVVPLTRREFLDKYSGAQRRRYERAADVWPDTRPEGLASATGFVKLQRIDPDAKIDADPRVVNFRRYEQAFALGRYIRPIEEAFLKSARDDFWVFRGPWLAKRRDLVQRAADIKQQFLAIPDCAVLSLDVSRYEAHINPELMALEHMIYNHMCRAPELRRLLRAQAKSKGSMEVGIKYSMQGRRLSGDMNTACGNAILMVLMVGTCMENVQYPFRIYDDGDDCLLFVPYLKVEEVRERMVTWFLKFGVTLKVEHVARVLEEVQFCQARPVYWGDGVGVLTPNPYKVMSQMYSGVKYGRSPKLDNRLLRTTADCCIHVYRGMPVLHAFHDLVYRSTRVTAKSAYRWCF